MKKIIIQLFLIFCLVVPVYASYFGSDSDSFYKYYGEDGEPDITDGDLEDKLGDSGYYYDMFPEEIDGEPDDSGSSYSGGGSNVSELTEDFIRNMPDIQTRTYRFEFPDGTTGYGSKADFDRIMREKYTYGAMKIGDNYYYKNVDGTFKTGWYEEKGKWYYFDPVSAALEKNQLVETDGKVYYLQDNYEMATNQLVQLGGKMIYIDDKGVCQIVDG